MINILMYSRYKNINYVLKKEATFSDAKIMRVKINFEGVIRKKKYVTMEWKIERATETLKKKNRRVGTNFEECDTDEAYHWKGLGH